MSSSVRRLPRARGTDEAAVRTAHSSLTSETTTATAFTTASTSTATTATTTSTATTAAIDVIVVSYHSRDYVLHCLASVLASTGPVRTTSFIVDNGSTDGTLEAVAALETDGEQTQLVTVGYNAGFAKASNLGIRMGTAEYVLLLNPDTEVAPNALATMTEFARQNPRAGVIAPRLSNPDGSDQQTARAFPTPAAAVFGRRSPLTRMFPNNRWSSAFLTGRDHGGEEPFQIDWVSGACLLVPRAVIDEVGPLDEGFFLFWEDADWCRRIKSAGYEVWCVPTAHVTHDEGGTREHGWPAPVLRHFHDGAYRYWRKHHAPQPWNPLRWLALGLLRGRSRAIQTRTRITNHQSKREL